MVDHCSAADYDEALYTQYFAQKAHPSAPDTLLKAATDAGVDQAKAEAFIGDEYEALPETKLLLREQASNGIDSVPYIVLEGKRRDLTLVSYALAEYWHNHFFWYRDKNNADMKDIKIGAKEVEGYLKELEQIVKESQ